MLVSAFAIFVGLVRELICEAGKSKISFRTFSRSMPLRSTLYDGNGNVTAERDEHYQIIYHDNEQ